MHRATFVCCVCVAVALCARDTRAQNIIADSFDDWSATGTQGENDWYNGWYNLTDDQNFGDGEYEADDFQEFENDGSNLVESVAGAYWPFDPLSPPNHWTGAAWELNTAVNPWTAIGQEATHPNGINYAEEHWTIRRWVSNVNEPDGAVVWHMRKTNLAGAGVTGKLFVDGVPVDGEDIAIAGADGVGVTRVVPVALAVGTIIDLALTPIGPSGDTSDGSDGSANRLTIYDGPPDSDGDGQNDFVDNCPNTANAGQADGDTDGVGDVCDNCPDDANEDQLDSNGDGIGDVCAPEIADSAADWSVTGTQGENNWYVGYYDVTADIADGDAVYQADDFREFVNDGSGTPSETNHWNGTMWDWNAFPDEQGNPTGANPPWTEVSRLGTHPQDNDPVPGHWTIRRYIYDGSAGSPTDVILRWVMRKVNTGCGDGVGGRLFLTSGGETTEVDSATIAGNDGIGVDRLVQVELSTGDIVDLALTSNDPLNDGCDGSENFLQVTREIDLDQDGISDLDDNCLGVFNPGQENSDGDSRGDLCDNCPNTDNDDQADVIDGGDGIGDVCDDSDDDTVLDVADNCPLTSNTNQADGDTDTIGNACDNCPANANTTQDDRDRDGVGDVCEPPAIADSFDDWSAAGDQGPSWYHGWYDRTDDINFGDGVGVYEADDFQEFQNDGSNVVEVIHDPFAPGPNHWDGGAWRLSGDAGTTGIWTFIGQLDTHPSGANGTNPTMDEHWTIRRWIADRTGELAIAWHIRKTNPAGTGVTGRLFINDEEFDSASILGGDTTGVKRIVVANINEGDTIDLALSPEGDVFCSDAVDPADGADGSASILRILAEVPPVPTEPPTVIASSEDDWSVDGTQGENNWFYGYYDQRADVETGDAVYQADDFIEFLNDGSGIVFTETDGPWQDSPNHWNGGAFDLLANATFGPWTEIDCGGGHPAANAQGTPDVHWTVRRWVSEVSGRVVLQGQVANTNAGCGDGITGRIHHNGEEIFAGVTGNGGAVPFRIEVDVALGDTLDFSMDPDGSAQAFDPDDALGTIGTVGDGCDGSVFVVTILGSGGDDPVFKRGDVDGVGVINLTDGVYLLNFLFLGGPAPPCDDAADANDDGALNITTGVYIFNWLFLGGPLPPAPGPSACGPDANNSDSLDCANYNNC